MRIRTASKAKNLHAAIDEAWASVHEQEPNTHDDVCPECERPVFGVCFDCQASDVV